MGQGKAKISDFGMSLLLDCSDFVQPDSVVMPLRYFALVRSDQIVLYFFGHYSYMLQHHL